ncbi:hypothetical protein OG785_33325 [Streptomyces sp. NBC_00006]|uniref:hypothetical protein n=1 Tax=Streptomyces sp. NBC_00006 TaxID=2975619 RepID=UPI002257DBD2|nr:hypothetical protein [Streptomyces sp. NBC_00006]MCX5535421.1 hypothetical protein [Streptomyces sp. NBC_00006]
MERKELKKFPEHLQGYFPKDQAENIHALAEAQGVPTAHILREAVKFYLRVLAE